MELEVDLYIDDIFERHFENRTMAEQYIEDFGYEQHEITIVELEQ